MIIIHSPDQGDEVTQQETEMTGTKVNDEYRIIYLYESFG